MRRFMGAHVRARTAALFAATAAATVAAAPSTRADAASPTTEETTTLAARVDGDPTLPYGHPLVVQGALGAGAAGLTVALDYRPSGTSSWSPVAKAVASRSGAYTLRASLSRSGNVRVTAVALAGMLRTTVAAAATATAGAPIIAAVAASDRAAAAGVIAFGAAAGGLAPAPSAVDASSYALRVDVHARLAVRPAGLDVLGGRRVALAGDLLPARRGRRVALQILAARGWVTVARGAVAADGRFHLLYRPIDAGTSLARVRFAGDLENASSQRVLGRLRVYRLAGASWYDGDGTTACGEQLDDAMLGVANKTLPCGTIVTLRYGERTVRVPVIDRGPYVAGREFDLTVATKDALGFGDTGDVWTTAPAPAG